MTYSVIRQLEQAWAVHKYAILEKDPEVYQKIRTLLKQKHNPDVTLFYALIEQASKQEDTTGRQNNALLHVWGYFKKTVTPDEKAMFNQKHSLWLSHQLSILELKSMLYALSIRYNQTYLLNSTYFDSVK